MSEAIYLEVYEATTGATGLKQLTTQVDPSVAANTTISYRSQSNQLTTYYNSLKVDQLILDAISSAGSGGAFVVVTNEAEFTAALENPLVIDIFCKRVDLIVATNPTNAFVTSSKNIYGGEGDFVLPNAMADYRVNFPTSAGVSEITISFYVPITGGYAGFGAYGGYVGSPDYKIRYSHSESGRFNLATNVTSQYESTGSGMSVDESSMVMWSGRTSMGSASQGVASVSSALNTGGTANHRRSRYDIAPFPYDTAGDPYVERSVKTEDPDPASTAEIFKETIDSNPAAPLEDRFKALFGGSSIPSFMYNELGHMSIGGASYPWDSTYKVIEVGGVAFYTDESGTDGVAYNCYYDAGAWRYKQSAVHAVREEVIDRVKSKYESKYNDTIVAGNSIPWTNARYDKTDLKYNYEFSTLTTGAVGPTQVQGNNATFTNSTTIYIEDNDLNGLNDQPVWFNLAAGEKIVIWSGSNWAVFTVTSASWTPFITTVVGSFTRITSPVTPSNGSEIILELIV